MSRIFVPLIMGADKGVVEGAQALELCHRYMPMETYGVDYMYACIFFSPDSAKHSQNVFSHHVLVHPSSATSPSFQPDLITNKFIIDS